MTYTITELAAANGLTPRALRFYEQRGLLRPGRAGPGTHAPRVYSENDALRLEEIVKGASYGLSLREIEQYLADGATGPWLDLPPGRAAELAATLDERIGTLFGAMEELREIAAKTAVGAIPGKAGTTERPRVGKRAPSAPRKAAQASGR